VTTEQYMIARKNKNWRFNNIVGNDTFMGVDRIHPLKQHQVKTIVDAAREDDAVKRVIIFGSSTRYDCDTTSDLDICIDWNTNCYDDEGVLMPFTLNLRKVISDVTQGNADVVNYAYLDDTVLKEAVQEGVVVYEHNV